MPCSVKRCGPQCVVSRGGRSPLQYLNAFILQITEGSMYSYGKYFGPKVPMYGLLEAKSLGIFQSQAASPMKHHLN